MAPRPPTAPTTLDASSTASPRARRAACRFEDATPWGYENLRFESSHGLARITLQRPDAANAIDLALARELADAALRCDEDPAVRAVLLTGEGKMFCAGGDIGAFAGAGDGVPALLKQITA